MKRRNNLSNLDYHEDVNPALFEELFFNTLLPNLPEGNAIVIDDIPLFVATKNINKSDIKEFLEVNEEHHYIGSSKHNELFKKVQVDLKARIANHIVYVYHHSTAFLTLLR
ncbi:hypothetical protein Trydic_g7082 [Trypoxylus dichotomus]